MHEVLVNRLGGLSLPKKSVVRLTDRPDMTFDVYRGRKTTMQQAVVHILNSQASNADYVTVLVRIITLKCLQLNVVLRAEHSSTSRNAVTDSLSRLQMNRFRQLAPEAEPEPESVPDHLWRVFDQAPTSL